LSYEAAKAGPSHCIALNAADEIAVAAFLAGNLPFLGIPRTIERVLELTPVANPGSIAEVLQADAAARETAKAVAAEMLAPAGAK
jgi:1-deoxy-D-xylulose-5-phosphate reductoisomerase